MIAFFGTYAQLRNHAKETGRSPKDYALMPMMAERLSGQTSVIEVIFMPDFVHTQDSATAVQIIDMYNAQFAALDQEAHNG